MLKRLIGAAAFAVIGAGSATAQVNLSAEASSPGNSPTSRSRIWRMSSDRPA
jgi:hypothetical protein